MGRSLCVVLATGLLDLAAPQVSAAERSVADEAYEALGR